MLLYPGITLDDTPFSTCFDELQRIRVRVQKVRRSRKIRDLNSLHRITEEVCKLCDKVQKTIVQVQERHSMWVKTCSRVASGAQIFVTARMRDQPRAINDEKGREAKKEFTKLSRVKIVDILSHFTYPDNEYDELMNVFEKYVNDIRQVFCHYACGSDGRASQMSLGEFRVFCKDINIYKKDSSPGIVKVTPKFIDRVFEVVNLDEDELEKDSTLQKEIAKMSNYNYEKEAEHMVTLICETQDAEVEDEENEYDNPDDQLVPFEFLESLVRIAFRKYGKCEVHVNDQVTRLLAEHVIKFGCHSHRFHAEYDNPEISDMFKEFGSQLRKIFDFYANLSKKKSSVDEARSCSSHMRTIEFMSMVKDCKMISGGLSIDVLQNLFTTIPRNTDIPQGWINFKQFNEALAVLYLPHQIKHCFSDVFPKRSAFQINLQESEPIYSFESEISNVYDVRYYRSVNY